MKKYKKIGNDKAYKLLNSGTIIIVCTKDKNGVPDIAPIAWQCPLDYDPVTKVLFICDVNHKTFDNFQKTKHFVICIPHVSQKKLVLDTGSVSGKEVDKIKKFKIKTIVSSTLEIAVPDDCIGFMECKLIDVIKHEGVGIVMGEVVNAMVDEKAFKDRLLSENKEGKTLHHLGSKVFFEPGKLVK
jgi:flavin reductase (DIM6/NTAB) family NADH-FMN oxidoreductase RutF